MTCLFVPWDSFFFQVGFFRKKNMKHKRDKDIQKIRMCWEIKVNTICNIFIWIFIWYLCVYTDRDICFSHRSGRRPLRCLRVPISEYIYTAPWFPCFGREFGGWYPKTLQGWGYLLRCMCLHLGKFEGTQLSVWVCNIIFQLEHVPSLPEILRKNVNHNQLCSHPTV